jgi:hypothetical protein
VGSGLQVKPFFESAEAINIPLNIKAINNLYFGLIQGRTLCAFISALVLHLNYFIKAAFVPVEVNLLRSQTRQL